MMADSVFNYDLQVWIVRSCGAFRAVAHCPVLQRLEVGRAHGRQSYRGVRARTPRPGG